MPYTFFFFFLGAMYRKWFFQCKNLSHLVNLLLDAALIRHNKPGITAFRLASGYAALKDALSSDNVRFQR